MPQRQLGLLLQCRTDAERFVASGPQRRGMPYPAVLLPFCHDQLSEASLEITDTASGIVVDTIRRPPTVTAPSLTALLVATADVIESGLPLESEHLAGTHHGWHVRRRTVHRPRHRHRP